jgi:hypothetical protein
MSRNRDEKQSAVSVGVERVLYEAATDPDFRRALVSGRERALAERGIELQPAERAVLANVLDETLEAMIDSLRVPEHKRRRFMKAVAAVSAGAAGVVLVQGCLGADKGVRPDEDAEVDPFDSTVDGTVDASTLDDAASFGVRPSPLPEEPEEPEMPEEPEQ